MLTLDFYRRPADELAPLLLGKLLCRNIDGRIYRYRITETEAYGKDDTACHAHKGMTPRNKPMFEDGGIAYVYLCYGIHEMFNIVAGVKDCPEAVLIRGVEGFPGPGKLTKALKIDRDLNGISLASNRVWLEDERSIGKKLDLAQKYEVAGISAWRLNFEKEAIWGLIGEYVRQK